MKADNELAVIDLLLVYRYTLSLTKNENMFLKKKTEQNIKQSKTKKTRTKRPKQKERKKFSSSRSWAPDH